jgi:hypothetical protein
LWLCARSSNDNAIQKDYFSLFFFFFNNF